MKKLLIKGGRRSMALFTLLLLAVVTFAVPAKPGLTRLLTLSDGSTMNAKLVGDEFLHYWLGEDGKAYQAVSQQQRGAKGVGAEVYQTFDLQSAKQSAAARRSNVNRQRARRLAPRKVEEISSISGDKKGIIILVNFTDKAFTATQSDFNNLANTVNYTSGNYKGSMYDYFYAQSDGQFRLTFDVVGPYTVSQNRAYYGANDSKGDDLRPGEMIKEAVQLANADVDFANYDWNGDDIVDQVYVVYAGKGEADGGASYTIWPHEWDLYSATGSYIELDGKIINTYACGGEQDGGTGKTAGIGTMCHEFSHCLGYPDFYDTDSSGGQGMGYWDLMDSGSYNDGGYQPAGYTSYERWVAGWKTPTELLYTQDISNMKALQDNGSDTYIIYNKGNKNEYYLLENRQKKGWDASLPGEGLLILHVDYNAKVWSDNEPNDAPSHQRMTWIAADNNYEYTMSQGKKYYTFDGMANDPFPYGSVNAFGKNTTPAATLYNENSDGTYYLDSSVENITQNSDGTISFSFKGIDQTIVAAPTDLTLSEVGATSITASWSAVDGADSYEIDVVEGSSFEASAGGVVLSADFSDTTGWTLHGTGSYTGAGFYGESTPAIKFDGAGDYAISPDFGSGTKLQFWALGNNGSGSTFAISGLVNGTWTEIETVTIARGGATYEVTLPAGTSQVRFDFTKQVNCALDDVVVYGSGSAPESLSGYPKSVGNVTTYAITGLTASTEYAVRVRAVNGDGNSDWSATATTTTAEEDPIAPAIAYYQNADGKTGAELKTALCGIIYNRTEQTYNYLWTAFQTTDVRSDGKIWDMYSNITNYEPVTSGSTYSNEGDCYNREHSFPQSWFGSNTPMSTDLHHIYPTDGYVNGKRSNNPFGETNGETYKSANDFSKLGACTYPGYTGKVFEPADEYKGDFARTYFYMVTCYEEKLTDWYTNYGVNNTNSSNSETRNAVLATLDGNKYPGLTAWQLNMLMEWAKNDPVSEKEIARNNAVYTIQNNRNPFIDYPGLEEYIWGTMTTTAFSYDNYVEPDYSTPAVTVPTLAVSNVTSNSADAYWTDCDGVTEYTIQLACDDQFTTGSSSGSGETLTETFANITFTTTNTSYADQTISGGDLGTWTATSCRGDQGAPVIRANGTLTSPTIPYGVAAVEFDYDWPFSESGTCVIELYVGDFMMGTVTVIGGTAGTAIYTLDSPLPGPTTIEFLNMAPNNKRIRVNEVRIVTPSSGSSEGGSLIMEATVDANGCTITGLSPETTYYARVKGDDDWSNVVSFTTNGALELANSGDNTEIINAAAANGGKYDVTLTGRTLYKDGDWNTLCLPFPLSEEEIAASDLAGADIRALSTASFDDGTLTLNFTEQGVVTDITAGTPYIIKWEKASDYVDDNDHNIWQPVFNGVVIDNTVNDKVCDLTDGKSITFKGTYEKLSFTETNTSILFLGTANKLYYPLSGASLGAQRAYFELDGITAADFSNARLSFGNDEVTLGISDVTSLNNSEEMANDKWYTLDGKRLDKAPTHKGLYIHNGKKIVKK